MENYQRIRDEREEKDMNQTQIAKILGTSLTVYKRFERNERKLPIDHLIKLCHFYKTSADYILGFTTSKSHFRKNSKKLPVNRQIRQLSIIHIIYLYNQENPQIEPHRYKLRIFIISS